ncbi:type 4a pilus biogenesis protein PilO [Candidatus Cyanaurora vandensis]|uniref:type 4a pilus biogenesis protein PilO n=1 Tax=Candidatus Cyanaurora vandensis TaxID=2714958 RepID=UPI002579EF72|nr:type 4a pilus biogenesis protein PilO [Candidatus Cyanaurora vandensis]
MTTQVFGIDLDRRSIALMVGLVLGSIVGVVAFNFAYPKVAEVQALDEQLNTARTNLDSQTQQRTSLAQVPIKLSRARQTFDNLTALLPKEADQSILLIDIARIAKGSQASLTQFTPGKLVATTEVTGLSNLYKSTSKVTVSGDFTQVLVLLKDLERLEQLLKVEDVTVAPGTKAANEVNVGPQPLTVTFNLSAYALPTGPLPPSVTPATAAPATPAPATK